LVGRQLGLAAINSGTTAGNINQYTKLIALDMRITGCGIDTLAKH
jgi:hypothetical protein